MLGVRGPEAPSIHRLDRDALSCRPQVDAVYRTNRLVTSLAMVAIGLALVGVAILLGG
jgi:hypothetical protein